MSQPTLQVALSLRETARLLGVDRGATLHRLIEIGAIRVLPWMGAVRVPRSEIDRILREGLPPLERRPSRRFRLHRDHGRSLRGIGDRIRAIRIEDDGPMALQVRTSTNGGES